MDTCKCLHKRCCWFLNRTLLVLKAILFISNGIDATEYERLAIEQGATSVSVRNPDYFREGSSLDLSFDIAFLIKSNSKLEAYLKENKKIVKFLSEAPQVITDELFPKNAKTKRKSKSVSK